MKKFAATLLTLCLLLAAFPITAFAQETDYDEGYYGRYRGKNVELNVYNWGEYISDGTDDSMDVNKVFEELTGIKVNYTTFDTNEAMYAKLKSGANSYDVIFPSDYTVARLIQEDMLEPLNFENIPNLKNVDPKFLYQDYDPENLYTIPYTWGLVGIIYNTEMVDFEVDSWNVLWDYEYQNSILMFKNPRDAFGIALMKLGYSLNTEDPEELERAAEELKAQKPLVQAYVMDQIFDKMQGGEAALAPYYAGDFFTMKEVNDALEFAIPKEGTNRFIDASCIPKGSKQKEAAEMYINFLNEPEVAAANIEYIEYSTPNTAAWELLDEEIRNDPVRYPSDELLQNTQAFTHLSDETNRLLDMLWTDILSADDRYSYWAMPAFVVACIAVSISNIVFKKHRKKKESRY